jgi:hypothetical protein
VSTGTPPNGPATGATPPPLRVWRDGAHLVVRRGFKLAPPRCVLCCGRAAGSAQVGARGALSLAVPLCSRHWSRHRRARLAGWSLGLVGFAVLVFGLALDITPLALLGLYASVGAAVYCAWARRVLTLERADRYFLRFRGADLRYLDGLRAWGDYPEPPPA